MCVRASGARAQALCVMCAGVVCVITLSLSLSLSLSPSLPLSLSNVRALTVSFTPGRRRRPPTDSPLRLFPSVSLRAAYLPV